MCRVPVWEVWNPPPSCYCPARREGGEGITSAARWWEAVLFSSSRPTPRTSAMVELSPGESEAASSPQTSPLSKVSSPGIYGPLQKLINIIISCCVNPAVMMTLTMAKPLVVASGLFSAVFILRYNWHGMQFTRLEWAFDRLFLESQIAWALLYSIWELYYRPTEKPRSCLLSASVSSTSPTPAPRVVLSLPALDTPCEYHVSQSM